ncbi:MAG: hypothetical protein CMJ58_04695 [Planctomycetaceae bacterium]|nr:hypothetical protein [Planctomycetaceae bacterium]
MRTLTRYILSEMVQAFTVTLVSMTVFVFLVLIAKEAVERGLGVAHILQLLPYILPQALQFTLPGAMLMAATSVYGRISSSNEIVAIKSLGISPMVVIWPSFALAAAVSLGGVVLNDLAVSWGEDGVKRVAVGALEDIAYSDLSKSGRFRVGQWQVNVQRVEGKRLIGFMLVGPSRHGGKASHISADEAQFHMDQASETIAVRLTNARGEWDDWQFQIPGEIEQSIPFADFTNESNGPRSPSNTPLRDIGPAIERQLTEISRSRQEMAADVGFSLLAGRTAQLSQTAWAPREYRNLDAQRTLYKLRTEPHRRWSNGFSCLGFVLIGAPMAIRRRHGEFWGSFFACFLPILLLYYPMLVGCVDQAKDGVFPPQAVWLGNIVLAACGAALMRRVIRF